SPAPGLLPARRGARAHPGGARGGRRRGGHRGGRGGGPAAVRRDRGRVPARRRGRGLLRPGGVTGGGRRTGAPSRGAGTFGPRGPGVARSRWVERQAPRPALDGGGPMKALVFHGPGEKSWEEVPDPQLHEATDAVVQVDTTTICGTDLHILKGDVPAVTDGRVLGHEGVGTVVEVGSAVRNVAVGDRVIIACISSGGVCTYCRSGNPSHCQAEEGAPGIGWILGHLIDGTQAELVRIPFADNSLYRLPEGVPDEHAMLL